ncbi:LOW QUALITY PROTEIN: uncharacterized protein C11orf16 homolog [Rhynchocyon petersi]
MDVFSGPEMPVPKYCSVTTMLKAPFWDGAAPPRNLSFTYPFALQAPWLSRFVYTGDPAWQPGWLGSLRGAAGTWVLARREPDGFYYRAQIKAAPELERQRTLLVEFEGPLVTGVKQSAQQTVVLEEEIVPLSPPMAHLLQPGDKVLAPWEPNGQRYGPGTVLLGLKAGDPQRASKDEKVSVHFWNGKTAEVPIREVSWIPPAVWKVAVERLHQPFTMEHPSPLLWVPCCSQLGPVTGCVAHGLPLGSPFLYPPCYSQACCQLLCQCCCLYYCPSAGPTWWPLNWTSEVTSRELPEPTTQLLPLEGPKEEEVAGHPPTGASSSSSSSSSEEDLETGLPQRLMVDSTVNADPIPLEKFPCQSGFCQPEWRYWRRNGPEPCPRKPGI